MAFLRKFTKDVFIVSNAVIAILFLLACSNGFLHPSRWWFISLLGLIFPLLLFLVFVFFVFWLFTYSRKWALMSALALIIGWSNIHAFFAFHPGAKYNSQKSAGSIRILTWNVRSWDEFITKKAGGSGHFSKMMDFLQDQDADLMCFQEFFESRKIKEITPAISYIQDRLHYPYYFFSRDFRRRDGGYETGVIIFSKYPILDSLRFPYPENDAIHSAESLIAADVDINGKTVRIFTTHLQSVLFQTKDFRDIEIIKNVDDSVLQASKSIVKKLKRAYTLRSNQADLVRKELDRSPYPAIICGDFNDLPNSYTYFHIRGGLQDAFIQKGFGIGRTYVHLSPTLRIDYIMAAQHFSVLQCRKFNLPYSDHHPVVADLILNPPNQ
jgi:endonuclease/exonuclease/phosphatase family metal-dependent hydrolase